MWRPSSWGNMKPKTSYELGKQTSDSILGKNAFNEGVEAGADAMLRGIVEMLDGFTFYDDAEGESAKFMCRHIKEILLKEDKDGS